MARWYLVSMHRPPKFYMPDGRLLDPGLDYENTKTITFLNSDGDVQQTKIETNDVVCGNIWMVSSYDDSIKKLESLGVYPFFTKNAAKNHAMRIGLSSFKYLSLPY